MLFDFSKASMGYRLYEVVSHVRMISHFEFHELEIIKTGASDKQ